MTKIGRFIKAYSANAFRDYPGWGSPELCDEDAYLFLQDDYTVTKGIAKEESVVFDQVTEPWIEYCRTQLRFIPPNEGECGTAIR